MRIFRAFFRMRFLLVAEYRMAMVIWMVGGFVSTLIAAVLWLISTPASGDLIGGMTQHQLITYAWLSYLLAQLIGWYPFYDVQREIQEGLISNYIIKPLGLWARRLGEEAAHHAIAVLLQLVGFVALSFILREYLDFSADVGILIRVVPSLIFSILIIFGIQMCLGLIAFWVTDTGPLYALFWIFLSLLGGEWIPNGLLPDIVKTINSLMPFRYTFGFPLDTLLNRITMTEWYWGIGMQLFWALAVFILFKIMWAHGLKKYSAVGG
ncbi:ABC-2 family transporter protein [candidate division WWE3 bacterium]|uniref:ABC-2 family transporter protein n=1 Tax=candidate division WWE3 bacterium TaxID=2053526 RepID=A0A955RPU3_UNCKA|nr:ABC-2 family transporter protein [candidate division WWE3 bacterium]